MRTASLCLLVLMILAPAALADYEETEHRLKAAGVEPALRKRIHRAIDRGVAYLLSRQGERGDFPRKPPERRMWSDVEVVPLAGLALRHAGTPPAKAGAAKAVEFLFPRPKHAHPLIHENIYVAGLTLMLQAAGGDARDPAGRIVEEIATALDTRTGWWGYYTVRGRKRRQAPDTMNLSTTQFAGLGLWAGGRLGTKVEATVWRKHLDALMRTQAPNGSWGYNPIRSNRWTYPCGTFMGTANLLLALEALKADPGAGGEEARKKARAALHRDGAAYLAGMRRSRWNSYTLYALEKACVFAGTERVGDTLWYRTGAEFLCDLQRRDGSWGGSSPVFGYRWGNLTDTAFALLFLVRASESYRPVTPRPVDSGGRVATEDPKAPAGD